MGDPGDASEAGPPSHETSPSPPPAKRTRRARAAKTPTPDILGSAPSTRSRSKKTAVLPSSSSVSVAGDVQVSTPSDIPDTDPGMAAGDSRASTETPIYVPTTRSKKRKADQIDSETPSVNGETDSKASFSQDAVMDPGAIAVPDIIIGTPGEEKPTEFDQDQDQPKRGRPPNRGRGSGRGRGGRARGGLSRQNSGVPEPVKKPSGRGGRGKKTSANLLVQAAYDRQAHLKKNYREVAKWLRSGLEVLAEKSQEMIMDDPDHYKQQPEYEMVMRELDAKHNAVLSRHGAVYNLKADYFKRKKEMDDDYARREFQFKVQDLKDKYESRCKAAVLEHIRNSKPVNDVHASVSPDEYFNFRLLQEEKTDGLTGEIIGDAPLENPMGLGRRMKKGSPKKRPTKEALLGEPITKRPSLLSAATAPPEEPDDGDLLGEARPPVIAEETAPTPEPQVQSQDDDDQPAVLYPSYTKRGRAPSPNNRAIVKPHFQFDADEIGFRSSDHEAEGKPAQPARFYYDQTSFTGMGGGGYKLSDHTLGDLDPVLVARHNLHPQSGLPVPGSCNPDNVIPRTDFSIPVARTNPIVFVSKDGKKTVETSRSAAIIHSDQDWAKFEMMMDMKKAIGIHDVRELFTPDGLATYDSVAREVSVTHAAVARILKAAENLESNDAHASAIPQKRRKPSANDLGREVRGPSPAAPTHPIRSANEVQEIARETFMKRVSPFQGIPGALEALADMAEVASRDVVRRSPAPAQFVHHNTIQTGFMGLEYSSGGRSSFSVAPSHNSSRKTKYPANATQVSSRTMAPPPKAPQSIVAQSLAPQTMVVHPMGPPPMATPAMAPHLKRSQKMPPLSTLPAAAAPRPVARQPTHSQSPVPRSPVTQSMAPKTMGPPKIIPQALGAQPMVPQLMSPRTMAPPAIGTPKMASPTMATPKKSQQGMGPPPVLPQPAMSAFTRPRSMSGAGMPAQTMLPPPTPSQMTPSQVHAPQHLAHAQQYFQGAQQQQRAHQEQLQQQQQQQQHQQQQQQQQQQQHHLQQHPHLQQQQPQQQQQRQPPPPTPPAASTPRGSRSGPSSSGLRDLLPRPDRSAGPPKSVPRAHRRFYENAAVLPPLPPQGGMPQPGRGYDYPMRGEPQAVPQPQQFHYAPPQPPPSQPLQFQHTTQEQQGQLHSQQYQQQQQQQSQSQPQHSKHTGQQSPNQRGSSQPLPMPRSTHKPINQQQTSQQHIGQTQPTPPHANQQHPGQPIANPPPQQHPQQLPQPQPARRRDFGPYGYPDL